MLLIYQEFMLAITQLSHFSDLAIYYNRANILQAVTFKGRCLIPLIDMLCAILLTCS